MKPIEPRLILLIAATLITAGTVCAWSTPSAVVMTSEDSLDPRMSVDSNGRCHVVWRERTDGTTFRIWYSNNVLGPFSLPIEISQATSAHSGSPVIAAEGSDLHAAWICDPYDTNIDIWYRKNTAGNWGSILNASNTAVKSLRPAIAARSGIGPVVAWDEAIYADDNYDTFFAEWNDAGFSSAINISNTAGGPVYGSVNANLVIAPNGDVTVVWADRITGDYHVNARRRVAGVWQPRQELSGLQTGPATPGIAVSSDSRVHVVYEAEGTIWHQIWNGSAWTAPVGLPGGLNSGIRPKITIDSEGFAHVVVDAFTDGNNRDIFYSTNAVGSWSSWVNISNLPGTQSLNPDIGYAAGLITVTWQENSNGAGGTGVYNIWYATQPCAADGPTGAIAGTVRDSFGHLLPGAAVSAAGYYYVAVTASDGTYSIPFVPVGTYSVTAVRSWHTSQTLNSVEVAAGETATVDFALAPVQPDPVMDFTVAVGNTFNTLSWTNPSGGNFAGTMIRFSVEGYPAGPADGTLLVDRPSAPGTSDMYEHRDLTNGILYYYTAFSRSDTQVYAAGVSACGRPFGPADFDHDGDVDQTDFGFFQSCFSGAFTLQEEEACSPALLDADHDVDVDDFTVFRRCLSGPDVSADSHCAAY
ncbi:MAG: carboxypeptidase regulatory-like domain-containing protein [Phycisphaerae bacterium]